MFGGQNTFLGRNFFVFIVFSKQFVRDTTNCEPATLPVATGLRGAMMIKG